MQPAPSPSKAVDTLLLLNDFSSYTSGTGKMVQLGASQSVTFRVQAVTHTAVVSDVGGDYAVLTIHSTPQTLHLNVGETKRVDANGDGIPDVSITLESIHNGVAQLRFAEITQAAVYLSASARPLMRTQSGRYAAYGVGTSMCVLLLVIALYIIRRRRSK
ncbi:MAG TPA: hypothetical protein VFT53_03345 [Candidatus Saccharimonadales bacterium]|nr:hypothetical protein [Candidatus Saccharimonadales bacterium]